MSFTRADIIFGHTRHRAKTLTLKLISKKAWE